MKSYEIVYIIWPISCYSPNDKDYKLYNFKKYVDESFPWSKFTIAKIGECDSNQPYNILV